MLLLNGNVRFRIMMSISGHAALYEFYLKLELFRLYLSN